jgi:hypothetical protein
LDSARLVGGRSGRSSVTREHLGNSGRPSLVCDRADPGRLSWTLSFRHCKVT